MSQLLLTKIAAVIGGLFSIFVVLYGGDFSNILLISLGLMFSAWAVLPFGLLFHHARRFAASANPSKWAAGLLLLAAISITAGSFAVYWQPFISRTHTDAQDGIVLVILPLYQLAAAGAAIGIAHLLNRN